MSAVSIDANNSIYPLAMCVHESENTNSWLYFMDKLYEQIDCNDGSLSFSQLYLDTDNGLAQSLLSSY